MTSQTFIFSCGSSTSLDCSGKYLLGSSKPRPLMANIKANANQSRTLATPRDALLPRLLSREISVHQVESMVGGET